MSIELVALAVAAGALALILSYEHPRLAWGIVVTSYLLPLTSFSLPDTRMLALAVIIVRALALGREHVIGDKPDGPLLALLAVMSCTFIASAAWSTQPETTLAAALAWAPLIAGLAVFRRTLHVADMRDIAFRIVLATLVVSTAASLVSPGAFTVGGRMVGIMSNANGLGVLCALATPWILRKGFTKSSIAGLCLVAYILYSSESRAGALGALVGAATLLYFSASAWTRIVAAPIIAVIAWKLASFDLSQLSPGTGLLRTNNSRADAWSVALDEFSRHTAHGIGFAALDSIGGSSFIKLAAEMGLVGLLVLACVLGRSLQLAITSPLSIAILVGGLGDALFESWLVAAGSFYCFLFFTVVVCAREGPTNDRLANDSTHATVRARPERVGT